MTAPDSKQVADDERDKIPSHRLNDILVDVRFRDKPVEVAYDEIVNLIEPFINKDRQLAELNARRDELQSLRDVDLGVHAHNKIIDRIAALDKQIKQLEEKE